MQSSRLTLFNFFQIPSKRAITLEPITKRLKVQWDVHYYFAKGNTSRKAQCSMSNTGSWQVVGSHSSTFSESPPKEVQLCFRKFKIFNTFRYVKWLVLKLYFLIQHLCICVQKLNLLVTMRRRKARKIWIWIAIKYLTDDIYFFDVILVFIQFIVPSSSWLEISAFVCNSNCTNIIRILILYSCHSCWYFFKCSFIFPEYYIGYVW